MAMHSASSTGHVEAVECLLTRGAEVDSHEADQIRSDQMRDLFHSTWQHDVRENMPSTVLSKAAPELPVEDGDEKA